MCVGGRGAARGYTAVVRLRRSQAAPPPRRGACPSAADPIRRPQGARPRPRPLWPHLRVPCMPSRARAQKRAAGARAREKGGLYVLACVSGSAHAGVRGHGEKGGSGRGGSASWGYVAGARRLARPPWPPSPGSEARGRCSGRRPCPSPPRSLDVELARPPVGASRPSRAEGGRGGHFVPTDSPEPGGAAGRGCGAAGAAPRRHGRRHRRGFLDEAVRKVSRSASRAAFSLASASPLLRPQDARARSLAVVSSTDPLGLLPAAAAASARAAPPNGEEDVRPAFQAAPDRGLGSGQDLRPFSFFG